MNTTIGRVTLLSAACAWLVLAGPIAQGVAPSTKQRIDALKSSDEAARVKAIDQLGEQGPAAAEAVGPLTDLLKDPSAKVRAHAARSLGEIGAAAKPAVPALTELLKDADETVRRQAVKAVIRIRPGPQVTVPLCVKLLEDSDQGVRIRILHAIAEAGVQAMPGLLEALKNDKAAYWACVVLREIGPAAKAAVPALAEKLKDPRPEVRREAALTLGAMKEAAGPAAPQLAALLGDEHARIAATFALGQIGRIPAEAEAQVRANARGDDRLLATVSLWALARVHPEDKELRRDTTERLIAALKDADPYVRVGAARALAALPPAPEITLPIWEKALQDADENTVRHALDALAALGPQAVPRLVDQLKHEKVRPQIAYILGQIGPPAASATEALAALVEDKNPQTAHQAVTALGKIGPGAKGAVPQLIKLLKEGEDTNAHAAAYALGRIGPDAAAADAALSGLLKSRDVSLSVAAAWALGKIRPANAETAAKTVPVLVAGLSSRASKVRQGAAETLGELGPLAKPGQAALEKAANDKVKAVRDEAAKALKSIGG